MRRGCTGEDARTYMRSRLAGNGKAAAVDFVKNGVAAAPQERLADFVAELHRILAIARFAKDR